MRPRAVVATALGLVACPVAGWAAHGATLAIAPQVGSCETSGGLDDRVPGLTRYLVIGGAAALVVLLAAVGGRLAAPVAILAAGVGSVIGDFQVTTDRYLPRARGRPGLPRGPPHPPHRLSRAADLDHPWHLPSACPEWDAG